MSFKPNHARAASFFLSLALGILFGPFFLKPLAAQPPPTASEESAPANTQPTKSQPEKALKLPFEGPRIFWDRGFRIENAKNRWRLKVAGKLIGDGGIIDTHGDVSEAYPELAATDAMLRRFTVSVDGVLGRWITFRVEVDFAQAQDVMDNWIRINKIPLLGQVTFGHQREPFSLDAVTSIHSRTFIEQSLAGDAMTPGRNIGIMANRPFLHKRMTAALGGYVSTSSFKNAGDARNQIDESDGYNFTGRLTGLPWYKNGGEALLHLGLSYTHQTREKKDDDAALQFRARPETRLTDTRLVDTGKILVHHNDMANAELALVLKNFSFQTELFHSFFDAIDVDASHFWGGYLYASYFITGEQRRYDASRGNFTRVTPKKRFGLRAHGWGAWEIALRFSHVDLNDNDIMGGIENNWTLGLNWYWNPYTRVMLNAIHGRVRDRETSPRIDSGDVNVLQARFQIAF